MAHGRQLSESLFWPEIFKKFPVLELETGSHLTAHTTIQSPQTGRFRYDAE
jgi:hypothetical protein